MLYCWQIAEDLDVDGNCLLRAIVVSATTEEFARAKALREVTAQRRKGLFARVLKGPPSATASESAGILFP